MSIRGIRLHLRQRRKGRRRTAVGLLTAVSAVVAVALAGPPSAIGAAPPATTTGTAVQPAAAQPAAAVVPNAVPAPPTGFTTTIETMDVRPGGIWKHVMHGPDGTDYPNKSVFIEVVKPERIVYSHGGGRKGAPGVQFEATWTFEALADNKTRLTIRMMFESAAARDVVVKEYGAVEGGKQTLGRLADYLREM